MDLCGSPGSETLAGRKFPGIDRPFSLGPLKFSAKGVVIKKICCISFWVVGLLVPTGCDRLSSIPYQPETTPERWLQTQPFVDIGLGPLHFILVQPSSTFFVYLLGAVAIGAGLYFLRIRDGQRSRTWWGIALLLWGVGALLAGTSYQAFSYEIKCAGRPVCAWTSWWEIFYLVFSAASVNAMMMAQAYACSTGKSRKIMRGYAIANAALYATAVFAGAFFLIRFLISFELLVLVTAPGVAFFLLLNSRRYYRFRGSMDLALLGTWVWLAVTMAVYFLYLMMGITHMLWARGIWFSENDVLHIFLIVWMIYIAAVTANRIVDAPCADAFVMPAGTIETGAADVAVGREDTHE